MHFSAILVLVVWNTASMTAAFVFHMNPSSFLGFPAKLGYRPLSRPGLGGFRRRLGPGKQRHTYVTRSSDSIVDSHFKIPPTPRITFVEQNANIFYQTPQERVSSKRSNQEHDVIYTTGLAPSYRNTRNEFLIPLENFIDKKIQEKREDKTEESSTETMHHEDRQDHEPTPNGNTQEQEYHESSGVANKVSFNNWMDHRSDYMIKRTPDSRKIFIEKAMMSPLKFKQGRQYISEGQKQHVDQKVGNKSPVKTPAKQNPASNNNICEKNVVDNNKSESKKKHKKAGKSSHHSSAKNNDKWSPPPNKQRINGANKYRYGNSKKLLSSLLQLNRKHKIYPLLA